MAEDGYWSSALLRCIRSHALAARSLPRVSVLVDKGIENLGGEVSAQSLVLPIEVILWTGGGMASFVFRSFAVGVVSVQSARDLDHLVVPSIAQCQPARCVTGGAHKRQAQFLDTEAEVLHVVEAEICPSRDHPGREAYQLEEVCPGRDRELDVVDHGSAFPWVLSGSVRHRAIAAGPAENSGASPSRKTVGWRVVLQGGPAHVLTGAPLAWTIEFPFSEIRNPSSVDPSALGRPVR